MLLLFWRSLPVTTQAETALATAQAAPAAFSATQNGILTAATASATATAPIAAGFGGFGSLLGIAAEATAQALPAILQHQIGQGAVVIPPPILTGSGRYTSVGSGAIIIPPPILSGEGATPVYGYGAILIDGPEIAAAGFLPVEGTGALVIPPPILSGVAVLQFLGTASITIPRPVIVGMAPPPPPGPPPPLPPSDTHVIEAYDINGVLLGRVQPIRRAKFTMVENDVGDFEIELPWIYDDVIDIMQVRHRIEYSIKNVKVFGGFIMKRQFRQEGRYSMVTLSGSGYNGLLTGRVIIPPATQGYDVYTNVTADDLMKNLVRNHLGEGAPVERRAQGFTVAPNLGQSATLTNYNGRYEPLIDALKNIAKAATDTKFLVVRNPNGLLEFRTYVPIIGQDRSLGQPGVVHFDMAGGNALNVEYVEDGTAVKNYIIGGGTGDEAARLIREGFNNTSINDWGRVEEFLDTSAKTTDELDLEILKKLEETSFAGPSLSFTVGQAGRYEYPVDFAFGDRVSALWKEPGLTLTDVISAITLNLEENGVLGIELSIGVPNLFRLSAGRALARFIKGIRGDVSLMQRH